MISKGTEGISIERLSDKERVELSISDFLKWIISELPIADKVNDEIKLNNGEVFRISSFQLVEMSVKQDASTESSNSETNATEGDNTNPML